MRPFARPSTMKSIAHSWLARTSHGSAARSRTRRLRLRRRTASPSSAYSRIDALHVDQRNSVPVDHLRVAALRNAGRRRGDLFGGAVFAQRPLVVVVLRGQIAGVHVVVGALESDQAAQLHQWRGIVIDAKIEDLVLPPFAGRFAADDDQRRRLLAADVATD